MSRAARLGVFIVVTLGILTGGVFVIGSREHMFGSSYQLKTQFDNVAGLAAGADVQIGGVHSGTVRSILLPHDPGGKVTLLMNLDEKTQSLVRKDSVASIETEGLLGNEYVAISIGSGAQASVKDGDMIASTPPLQMSALLAKADGILDNGQQAVKNVNAATAHINSVSAKIDSGKGTVGALVNDKQLYNNVEQTTADLRTTVAKAQTGVTDFQENMEALKHNFLLSGYFKKRGYENTAELKANRLASVPKTAPVKTFEFEGKKIFDKQDSAKLKHEKALNEAGKYLSDNEFGLAVVQVSAGREGDAAKDQTLTDARAAVVREYLVTHFGFDDTALKTFGAGKDTNAPEGQQWGSVKILIFPQGTDAGDQSGSGDATPDPSGNDASSKKEGTESPKQ